MGKKPFVGLIGLVWAGIALTGCGETTRNSTQPKYSNPSAFGGKPIASPTSTSPATPDATAKTATPATSATAGAATPASSGIAAAAAGTMTPANTMPPEPRMPNSSPTMTQTSFPPAGGAGSTGSPFDQSRPSFGANRPGGSDNQRVLIPNPPVTPAGMSAATTTPATAGTSTTPAASAISATPGLAGSPATPAAGGVPAGTPLPTIGGATPSSLTTPPATPPATGAGTTPGLPSYMK